MKIIEPGHVYELAHVDGEGSQKLIFVNREFSKQHEGTQTQEVVRALINRTHHCHSCLYWPGNETIIQHLRMVIALHEARALVRKAEKELYKPELVEVDTDGHFRLSPKE